MRLAPVGDRLEAFALVARELLVDVGGAHDSNLRRLEHGHRVIVVVEEHAPVAGLRDLLALRFVIEDESRARGLLSVQN